jgi:hypothetical protein
MPRRRLHLRHETQEYSSSECHRQSWSNLAAQSKAITDQTATFSTASTRKVRRESTKMRTDLATGGPSGSACLIPYWGGHELFLTKRATILHCSKGSEIDDVPYKNISISVEQY